MSEDTQTMIQHALDQDWNKANKIFGDMMSAKVQDVLDQEKIRLADQIYNGAEEEIEDESNHNGAEQESLLEQERFVWTEIRNLYSEKELEVICMSRGLDGRLFSVDRQAGWLAGKNLV